MLSSFSGWVESSPLMNNTEKWAPFSRTSTTGNKIRHEYFDETMSSTEAFDFVSRFYTDKAKFGAASESFRSGTETVSLNSSQLN